MAAVLAIIAGAPLSVGTVAACSEPTVTINAEAMSEDDIAVFEKSLRSAIGKVCA